MHLVDITLFYSAEGGGVRTYLAAKAEWLRKHGAIRHTVVAPKGNMTAADHAFVTVPSLSIRNANGYHLPRSVRQTARTLAALQPDLIEVGDPYQFAWAALRVQRSLRIPVVAFFHSALQQVVQQRFGTFAARAARRYTALLYHRFDLVLAPSQLMVEHLREIGVAQVRHQPLGVDTRIYTPAARDPGLRARLGLPPQARLLIYAGRCTREKKLPLLIDAVHKLGPPYYLLLVGGTASTCCTGRIVHVPYQRDPLALAGLMASCDLLVHPGDQETFGLVVLEAMACGLPVLGVNAGGVRELIDRTTGLLVAPGCAAALAEGIVALYDADCKRLGAQARHKVMQHYDWDVIFPQLLGQYARLFATRQQPGLEADLSLAAD